MIINKRTYAAITNTSIISLFLLMLLAIPENAQAVTDVSTIGRWIQDSFMVLFHQLLTAVPGLLVFVTGILLNTAIDYLIIGMGALITGDSGIGYVINIMWEVVRDVMNIFFIFSLIYIGIKTILNAEDSNTRRLLGSLIVAALLVNFSLFATKAIVDISNVAATQVYQHISVNGGSDDGWAGYKNISGAFMNVLGIHSITASSELLENRSIGAQMSTIFMSMILMLIASIVFAAGAFMIIARFIALIFYMIFSPLMFLGWVLPAFKGFEKKWWDGFLKYTFFAPAYIFMLFISLYILNFYMASISTRPDLSAGLVTGETGGFNVILVFFVAIGMMIGSIIVAQKMSIAGATTSLSALKSAGKNVQSYAGRNVIGNPANRIVKWMDKGGESSKFTKGWQRTFSAATLGATGTGGPRSIADSARNNSFGGKSYTQLQKEEKEHSTHLAGVASAEKIKKNITEGSDAAAGSAERIALERSVADASTKQLEDLGSKTLSTEVVAGALSSSQFDNIMKSDKLNDEDKGKIAAARNTAISTKLRVNKDDAGSRVQVEKASTGELMALGGGTLAQPTNAVNLSGSQMDDLKKKLTESEYGRIDTARTVALENVATGSTVGEVTTEKLLKRKSADIAKLPKEVFGDNEFTKGLSAAHLKAISDKQSNEVQIKIRKVLNAEITKAASEKDTYDVPNEKELSRFNRLEAIYAWLNETPQGIIFGI